MKVSIIIPYNKDRGWLDEAVKSVEEQTYKDIELIMYQSSKGVSYNLNRGIERSTGDFIKYLCDDDYLTPHSVQHSVDKILEGYDFIHGNELVLVDNEIQTQMPRKKNPSFESMILNNVIRGGTLMYKRECFNERMFDESLDCGEEYDFNLYLLKNGFKLGYSPEYLYVYRRHDLQKSLGKGIDQEVRRKKIHAIKMKYA